MSKSIVVIDGTYFIKCQTKAGYRIDAEALIAALERRIGSKFVEKYFVDSKRDSMVASGYYTKLKTTQWSLHLHETKNQTVVCSHCNKPHDIMRQKGVDVKIATLILTDLLQKNFDSLVLISGDGDFTPALDVVKQKLKTVYVSGLKDDSMSTDLQALCPVGTGVLWFDDMWDEIAKPYKAGGVGVSKGAPPVLPPPSAISTAIGGSGGVSKGTPPNVPPSSAASSAPPPPSAPTAIPQQQTTKVPPPNGGSTVSAITSQGPSPPPISAVISQGSPSAHHGPAPSSEEREKSIKVTFPKEWNEARLRDEFKECGAIHSLKIVDAAEAVKTKMAFVNFVNSDGAQKSLSLSGKSYDGIYIRVKLSKGKKGVPPFFSAHEPSAVPKISESIKSTTALLTTSMPEKPAQVVGDHKDVVAPRVSGKPSGPLRQKASCVPVEISTALLGVGLSQRDLERAYKCACTSTKSRDPSADEVLEAYFSLETDSDRSVSPVPRPPTVVPFSSGRLVRPRPPPASQEEILREMHFPEDRIQFALRMACGDIDKALSILLEEETMCTKQ